MGDMQVILKDLLCKKMDWVIKGMDQRCYENGSAFRIIIHITKKNCTYKTYTLIQYSVLHFSALERHVQESTNLCLKAGKIR